MTEEPRSRGRRVLGAVGLGALVALLFLVPSAYAIHRGVPRWLAMGAAVFPLSLIGWHLLAERGRQRAGGKTTLTSSDRFVMRLIAVAVLAIGPLLLLDRGGTWAAITGHGAWWLDWSDPPAPRSPVRDGRVLAPVPEDAEGLLWSSGATFFDDVVGGAREADGPVPEEALVGVAPGRIVIVMRGEQARLDSLSTDSFVALARARGVTAPLTLRRPADDLLVVMSDQWVDAVDARLAGGGRRPALADRLIAPPGALGVAVWRPRQPPGIALVEARVWLTAGDDHERLEAVLTTSNAGAGDALRRGARTMIEAIPATFSGECAEHARSLVAAAKIAGAGAEARVSARVSHDLVTRMFGCIAHR